MAKEPDKPARVKRPMERRRGRGRVVIHVTEPGRIVIDQGTREDHIDAPPGSVIRRPKSGDVDFRATVSLDCG